MENNIVHGTCTDIVFVDKKIIQCIINLDIKPHGNFIPSYYQRIGQTGTLDLKVTLYQPSMVYFFKLETIPISKLQSEMVFGNDGRYMLLRKGESLGDRLHDTFCESIFPKLRKILDDELVKWNREESVKIAILNKIKALTDMAAKQYNTQDPITYMNFSSKKDSEF